MLFAVNFKQVSGPQTAAGPELQAAGRDQITLESPPLVTVGETVLARLLLSGSGRVQGVSVQLAWDPAVVAPVRCAAGELLEAQGGVAFSAEPGGVDAAGLGLGHGLVGEGLLATVEFRVLAIGDPRIRLARVAARDAQNQELELATAEQVVQPLPSATRLLPAIPNPFRGSATLAFSLARGGPVSLAVYSVDGRRIRSLLDETRQPGEYRTAWDGCDDGGTPVPAGIYFARLKTVDRVQNRTLTFLK